MRRFGQDMHIIFSDSQYGTEYMNCYIYQLTAGSEPCKLKRCETVNITTVLYPKHDEKKQNEEVLGCRLARENTTGQHQEKQTANRTHFGRLLHTRIKYLYWQTYTSQHVRRALLGHFVLDFRHAENSCFVSPQIRLSMLRKHSCHQQRDVWW